MKLTSVKYLAGNGFKNIWLNKLMSIASIGVLVACMSVIGLAVAVSYNIDSTLDRLEEQNTVMVYMNDRNAAMFGTDKTYKNFTDVTDEDYDIHSFEEAIELCAELEKLDNVRNVTYFTSDLGLQSVVESMNEEDRAYFSFLNDDDYGNPMPAAAKVSLIDLSKFDETIEQIKAIKGVDDIYTYKGLAEKIMAIKHAITIIGFWIVAILLIISLVIVSNTIRVTMYSRKLEISIMKAVGATDSFVRLPFMIEGVTIGLLSAVITVTVLYFVYNAVMESLMGTLELMSIVPFSEFFGIIFGIFAAIGIVSGLFASAFMINKYLRKEGSEFRAL